eukprot:GHVU01164889.1.p1 GENE.GHVU01164889.1~~GHVU01164889.1.p1  ORF type:complete len:123 (-),score=1.55 GHVU01164889.1:104-472(-)
MATLCPPVLRFPTLLDCCALNDIHKPYLAPIRMPPHCLSLAAVLSIYLYLYLRLYLSVYASLLPPIRRPGGGVEEEGDRLPQPFKIIELVHTTTPLIDQSLRLRLPACMGRCLRPGTHDARS